MARHFLSQNDLDADEARSVLSRARALKALRYTRDLQNRTLIMFFEKASTRTRLSFEIGMTQLGGHAVYLDRESSQLSRGESIADTASVVSRYADLLMARVYAHSTLEELAAHASIPVINGLSDLEHPCQALADVMTIEERAGAVRGLRVVYVGDGNNNVTHSLMLAVTQLGGTIVVSCPPELAPERRFVEMARDNAGRSGGAVFITEDPTSAVEGADVIYTDVWVSMGREKEREERVRLLQPYQVNAELAEHAKADYLFMHCLPAHIGDEVTSDVAYGRNSVIFDQAENRLHAQKALMVFLLEEAC